MKKVIAILYTIWGVLWFWVIYLLLFPIYLVIAQRSSWHYYAYLPNKLWGFCTYFFILVPVKVVYKAPLLKHRQYILCANHTSFLGYSLIGFTTPNFVKFIGKSSLAKVPIFGYMFSRLHISVDRSKNRLKYLAFTYARKEIDKGFSLAIFPEGSIKPQVPKLGSFKDGAFRIAIEKQLPIVPVTIKNNWKVLSEKSYLRWAKVEIIYHKAIETQGLDASHMDDIKYQCRQIIHTQLQKSV